MNQRAFADVLVKELVDSAPERSDLRKFYLRNGFDPNNLNDANEIWKVFVRYNLDSMGTQSLTVEKHWNTVPVDSILKQRTELCDSIRAFKLNGPAPCYADFTNHCRAAYSKNKGFIYADNCCAAIGQQCPVVRITNEISWHRAHYKVARIIVECAKRLLIENEDGNRSGNLNDIIKTIFQSYKALASDYRIKATRAFIDIFDNIKGYGMPPKVIVWLLSDLGSPVHQINHWPETDLSQLTPIDTHVQRLAVRFGFVSGTRSTSLEISKRLAELYPEEPRKLNFAMYRLASEAEENICAKTPQCSQCKVKVPGVYNLCPANV